MDKQIKDAKTQKLIQACLLAAALALPAAAQAQFGYTTSNGRITITSYTGPGGAVTIPSSINGLPITSIGVGAFAECTALTDIDIGDGVTNIGAFAFDRCYGLATVRIGQGVVVIGGGAFRGCSNLTSITIPDNVLDIQAWDGGFSSASGAFEQCSGLANATIGHGVTNIGELAFALCTRLESITIPASVMT